MAAVKKQYSMDELEVSYHQIEALYELISELVDTVEDGEQLQPDTQLALVGPLIDEITDATDALTEEFLLLAKANRIHTSHTASKSRIEGAMRRIYVSFDQYAKDSSRVAGRIGAKMKAKTDHIIAAIGEQIEQVIGIFLDFMRLSLAPIMGKTRKNDLVARNTHIAFQLHQMSKQAT